MEAPQQTLVVTCLVRNAAGNIILVSHYRRGWELPQGRVEHGEMVLAAVHREVKEETGVEIQLGPLSIIWSKVCEPQATILGFTGNYLHGTLTASDETPEVAWFSPEEALCRVSHQVNRERLHALLHHSGDVDHRAYLARPFTLIQPTEALRTTIGILVAAVVEPSA